MPRDVTESCGTGNIYGTDRAHPPLIRLPAPSPRFTGRRRFAATSPSLTNVSRDTSPRPVSTGRGLG
ncbi:hypothetical protein B5K11_02665 [Rhizobium leguminosarum bv. trifolii]|nr:hypothetical protein B5K11_02665 [Rhizobium leguminosarum bv. trifolii]